MLFLTRAAARSTLLLLAIVLIGGACATGRSSASTFQMGDEGAKARARADSLRYPYTTADIEFMQGMIHHHAQAILISRWAATHGASDPVQRLTARIINAQADEIRLMQYWLRDRNQTAMDVDTTGRTSMPATDMHAGHDMAGMTAMPGMLTDEQLAALEASRGAAFDELFLNYMIQHHRGAVTMVKTLFAAYGAGQDETIFKFANDVDVDQSTEIRRMMTMLLDMGAVPPSP